MANYIPEIQRIRARLGCGLREAYEAYQKYGSYDAAIAALIGVEIKSWSELYEELRAVIDGGSETMTHEEAVSYLKIEKKSRELFIARLEALRGKDHDLLVASEVLIMLDECNTIAAAMRGPK